MNKIIVVLFFIVLAGCDTRELTNSITNSKCMETVANKYPTAQVIAIPDHKYEYIVIESDGIIRYVTVPGKYDEIRVNLILGKAK